MDISVERYHYPIGQGTFSAQIIRTSEKRYVCVYDCGSSTFGNNIEKYAKELHGKTSGIIDLLVISHLDDDHVNGIRTLYKEGFFIKKVIMPYMTKWERILFFLDKFNNDLSKGSNMFLEPRELYAFLLNNGGDGERYLEVSDETEVVFSGTDISVESVSLREGVIWAPRWEFVHFSLFSNKGDAFECSVINDFMARVRKDYKNWGELQSKETFSKEELKKLKEIYHKVYESHRKNSGGRSRKILNSNRSSIILYSGFERESFRGYVGAFRRFNFSPLKGVNYSWIATGILCTCHIGISRPMIGLFHGNCCKNYSRCFNFKYHKICKKESYEDTVMNQSGKIPITGWLGTGDAELSSTDNCWELVHKLGMWRMRHVREITVPHHGGA